MRSCGAWLVGVQRHPAAVEHVSTPLFWCNAGKVAECLRNKLYIGLCTGKRGCVIHSRQKTGADERRLEMTAGVQSELLHSRICGELMQALHSPRPHLLHGLLDLTADPLQTLLLSYRELA